jgi:DHA1 family multidrug resistance protein-like MFS transporter
VKKEKSIFIIYLAVLTFALGYGFIIFLYPIYAKALGANSFQIGILYSLMTLWMSLVQIPGGWLADRMEPKKIIVYTWFLVIPGGLIYFLAKTWIHLAFADFLLGISMIHAPAVSVYILTLSPSHKLGEVFSFIESAYPLGLAITPLLGGWLADRVGMKPVFFLCFVFYTISFLLTLALKPLPKSTKKNSKGSLKNLRFISVLVFFSFLLGTEYIYLPFFPTFLKETKSLSFTQVGLLASFIFLINAIFTPRMGKLADRYGLRFILLFTLPLYGFSLFGFTLVNGISSLLLVAFSMGTARQFWTLSTIATAKTLEETSEGMAYGILNLSRTGVTFFAPLIGGLLDGVNPHYPLFLAATVFFLSLPLAISWPLISRKILN